MGVLRWREVVVAGALVAERFLDQDEVRRVAHWRDPARGGHADEESAPRSNELLRHEDCERSTDRTADDSKGDIVLLKPEKLGVIAGPRCVLLCFASRPKSAYDIAVRIQDAHVRNGPLFDSFLSSRLAEQVLGCEGGGMLMEFAPQNRRNAGGSCVASHGMGLGRAGDVASPASARGPSNPTLQ